MASDVTDDDAERRAAAWMAYERHVTKLFMYGIDQLKTADVGLASGHDLEDLNAVALLAAMVKWIACKGMTPADILLYNLADATEQLLTTAVLPAEGDPVKRWLLARGEYLACQLGGL